MQTRGTTLVGYIMQGVVGYIAGHNANKGHYTRGLHSGYVAGHNANKGHYTRGLHSGS